MEFAGVATQELTVSTGSAFDDKERIRQAVDIVDLVGSHMQLRRQGRNYVALCPWHDDSRPSLQVNPERQSFKCWVCDIGGDVFSFVMQMEGVEFREAMQMLADRAGIALGPGPGSRQASATAASGEGGMPAPVSGERKRTLYKAMAWAEQLYHRCLLESPDAEPARNYLQQRGITAESIEQFHLGFSPNKHGWLLGQVKGSAERTKILETIGLVARPQDGGQFYDRFRGRVLFPIRDTQNRPVGVGGRILPESGASSPAKYINSPETPLFSKSNLLYGLDVAREAMRKSRTALVMEGYTDCIVAHQYGFTDAVAVLGTALGEGHIKILKRFSDRIVLVLDGDNAGQDAVNKVLELFVAAQVDLHILTLPEGTDPCDFLQQNGAEAFGKLLAEEASDALEHAFRSATRGLDLQRDVHGASQALDRLVSIVAKAPRLRADTTREDRFREEKILQRLAAGFRIDEKDVRQRMTVLRRRAASRASLRPKPTTVSQPGPQSGRPPEEMPQYEDGQYEEGSVDTGQYDMGQSDVESAEPRHIDPAQRELLELLVAHPECLPAVREAVDPRAITSRICRAIYETSCRLSDAGIVPTFDRLMLEFDQAAVKSLLVELDEGLVAKGQREADPATLVGQLIENFERQEMEKRRPGQIVELREGGLDDSQETELLEKIIQQERNRQGISEPKDG